MERRRHLKTSALFDLDSLQIGFHGVGSGNGSIPAKHKWSCDASPYCVANEFICGEIGRILRLPIPPFAITHPAGMPNFNLFSTVLVDFNGRDYSPVLPEECVSSMPGICTGILLFDVLIANGDRHDENLLVDQMVDPRDIRVIDHDAALFGTNAGQGIERLKNLRDRLGISSGPITGGNRHVFLDHLSTNEHMGKWIDTISWLPHPFITQVCTEAIKLGISKEEADEAAAFICDRRINLRGILNRHHKQFSQVNPWKTV